MLLLITCAILLFTGCQSMSIADQNGYIKIGSSCTSVTKGVEVGNKIVFSSLTECLNSNTDMKEEPIFEGLDYPQSNDNYCNEYQKDGWLFTTAGFSRCKQVTEGACRDARDFTFIYNSECDCVKEEILKKSWINQPYTPSYCKGMSYIDGDRVYSDGSVYTAGLPGSPEWENAYRDAQDNYASSPFENYNFIGIQINF